MADLQTYKSKRKGFILAAMALLLIAAAISIAAIVRSEKKSYVVHESVVRSTCGTTLYPDLCISTVKKAAAASFATVKSPRDVLLASLNYTIYTVGRNYFTVKKIAARRNLTKRENAALHDCLEMIDDTLDQLHDSETELRNFGFKNYSLADHKENLKTLLSAAMTNQGTCLDGFSHNSADKVVRAGLIAGQRHVFRLVSNVLAIISNLPDSELAVNSFAVNLSSPAERTVGEDGSDEHGWPKWLTAEDRRFLQATDVTPDITVAADGSGNYRTVADAVAAAPEGSKRRYVIKIKAGVYRENVTIPKKKENLTFVGEGRLSTIITASMNVHDGGTTFQSATVAVVGRGFLARDITFQNAAGPYKDQAVALRVNADYSAFCRCSILGYQDTLYVHSLRQFYTQCVIVGTVDFIFGNAAVVIQNSDIKPRLPRSGQRNMVTAQNREDPNENTGIVIQKCRISANDDLEDEVGNVESYLGRPWGNYSRTVVMQTEISNVIHPHGWYDWNGDTYKESTVYYAEYKNTGPGSDTSNRVTWPGVKRQISTAEAEQFTAGKFISGGTWLSKTGCQYFLGF